LGFLFQVFFLSCAQALPFIFLLSQKFSFSYYSHPSLSCCLFSIYFGNRDCNVSEGECENSQKQALDNANMSTQHHEDEPFTSSMKISTLR
jgi:hypothetical protein